MSDGIDAHSETIDAIRRGDPQAWQSLIEKFEGRLVAFAERRLRDRAASEDIVQETFIGFLNSLPNYDTSRPLESYLFTICAYKLTDHLRRQGRRPPIVSSRNRDSDDFTIDIAGSARMASSIARSGERKRLEEDAVAEATGDSIQKWKERGEWQKLKCLELLLVCGMANKDAAAATGLSEQQVANLKSDFYIRLKAIIGRRGLSADVFPELQS